MLELDGLLDGLVDAGCIVEGGELYEEGDIGWMAEMAEGDGGWRAAEGGRSEGVW